MAYSYTSLGGIDTIGRGGTELVDYNYYGSSVSGRDYTAAGVGPINVRPTLTY